MMGLFQFCVGILQLNLLTQECFNLIPCRLMMLSFYFIFFFYFYQMFCNMTKMTQVIFRQRDLFLIHRLNMMLIQLMMIMSVSTCLIQFANSDFYPIIYIILLPQIRTILMHSMFHHSKLLHL